ncbi:EamA family transporter [Meridianimarinicoccus roseus]|jgi:drug/metabolite transporter (DMT)-like permease|uniref:EamA family transporter n=2 Tax=Meridianimarinicoccus roseus TaxID=2072018 RepID=A0A2V2LKJ6_9RHOB|nr:EamA family transporter [Meridianimarinicoccus roseus]
MVLTGLCFVGVQATVKALGDAVPAPEAAFLRYALGLVFVLPMLRGLRAARLTSRDWTLFGMRGVVHGIGVIFWFYAMTRIPIAEVTAINYLAPVVVTLGAVLFLGERMAARRIGAVIVALVGALVILRPGLRTLDPGHLAMLVTAGSFGASYLLAKSLSGRFPADVVVALLSLIVPVVLLPVAVAQWVTPGPAALAGLLLVAAFATAGHYTMTLAFRAAPVSVTQPAVFLQLVWSVLVGFLVFGEPVDPFVVLGGAIVVAAVSFIALREQQLKRRALTPNPLQTKS